MLVSYAQNIKGRNFFFTILFIVSLAHVLMSLKHIGQQTFKPEKVEKKKIIRVRLAPQNKKKKQIVRTEKSDMKSKPNDTKFLSENDQAVAREVVSKNVDKFNKAGLGVRNGDKQSSKLQKQTKKRAKKKSISFKDLKIQPEKIQPVIKKKSLASVQKGERNGDKRKKGLSSSNDFIEDVELGDLTQLNTVRFKYFGFYERIRSKLEQYWGTTIQEKARKLFASRGRFPASQNFITSLQVVLDAKGKIIGINIKGSSGVKDLDDAAIESFNKAGPFPNPPKGLVKNGRATIEWGFVVKS
jgi:TonB family protein